MISLPSIVILSFVLFYQSEQGGSAQSEVINTCLFLYSLVMSSQSSRTDLHHKLESLNV